MTSCDFIPIDLPVSIRSCGTSRKHNTVVGRTYTKVARNRNDIFISSSMPNQRISSGEKAVTGMYLIAETIGEIISFNVLNEHRINAIGTATAVARSVDAEILANE